MKDTDVPTGGYVGLMADYGFEPKLKDTILRGTEILTIPDKNGIDELNPAGDGVILYRVRFQK
jgi:hypothetical protein